MTPTASTRASLLPPDAPEWVAVLGDVVHDFYHLPAYVALCAAQEGATARALYVEDGTRRMLLPLLVRDGLDAASPYGYPGPVGDPAFFEQALRTGLEHLRAQDLVSVFVRLHPLLEPTPPPDVGQLVRHGDTVSIDLTLSTEALWTQTSSGHRNQINRALRAGHRAYFDETWEHYDAFQRLYLSTMGRVGAAPYYRFDKAYFEGLRQALGSAMHLCVVEIEGAMAAAGLFVETNGLVEYHLSGSDERFARERPTKLMLHTARGWAKERGDTRLHLGGGVGGSEDSLFLFKAGFSQERHPFYTLRMIANEERYADLVRARRPDTDVDDLSGYFPAYRTPR